MTAGLRQRAAHAKYTDIAIIGGVSPGRRRPRSAGAAGFGGVVDPHAVYPFDFRVEKLGGAEQIARFRRRDLRDAVLAQGDP